MAKKMKKTMSMILVLCMMASMFSLPALAAETVTTDEYKDGNGNNVVVTTTTTTTSEKNEQGATVDTTIVFTETEVTTDAGEFVSYKWTEDGVEKTEETKMSGGTVEVSTTEGEKNSVSTGDEVDSETIIAGSVESGDYTKETVESQGSITVETTDVEVKENISEIVTDMNHVSADVTPDGTNDLINEDCSQAPEEYLPGNEAGSPIKDSDYSFVYQGSGNTSKFVPAVVYTEPMSDEEILEKWGADAYLKAGHVSAFPEVGYLAARDENGKVIKDAEGYALDENGNRILRKEQTAKDPEGNTVYLHRIDKNGSGNNVEGWYEDGQWVEELNGAKYGAVWAGAQQFVLVDSKSGEVVTTYCADINDPTEANYGYNLVNLEDAGYYTEEQAERIRSIASKGYWGTDSKYGSLEAMKAQLLDSGMFTAEELESLTDGVALTATQMAIWSCSNHMSGVEFINAHYIKGGDLSATDIEGVKSNGVPYSTGDVKTNIPESKEDEVVLMFKVYEYLKNLEGTEVAQDTSETVINEKNFIKNLCVSVIDKVVGHNNNKDDDKTNDAYVTNVTFALEVKPAEGNNDELVVTVKTADGKIYKGRIAGTAKEDEVQLVADENGNYSFSGITMIEGKQNFNITLEGVQNLKEGVYLYTSEVRGTETSQTMVGVASGKRDVNVTMDIVFELNVDDEVISKERVWHDEGDPGVNVPPPAVFAVHRPLENIPEEEVPLADAPQTGDEAIVFAALTLLAGISLMAMHVSEKKRKEEI